MICFIVSKMNTNKVNMYVVDIYINILNKRELMIKQKWIYKYKQMNDQSINSFLLFMIY